MPVADTPPDAARLGLAASAAAFVCVVGFGVAQIAQVMGGLPKPLDEVLIFGFSLGLAPGFLLAVVALHAQTSPGRRVWSLAALAFAVLYVGQVSLVYTVQLASVIPRLSAPGSWLLAQQPHSLFWDMDGLGYVDMGIAALFAGLALAPAGRDGLLRGFLLAHGGITPVIAFVYCYPAFSIPILLLGSPWLITATGAMLLLARHFQGSSKAGSAAS